ncbi:MAG: hypothetical protein WDZ48_04875 [Pirellulales bacterium]
MTFQFLCPQGHLLQGEEAHMGMQCQCPQCGVAFIIPTVERSTQAMDFGAAPQSSDIGLAPLEQDDAPAVKHHAPAPAGGLEALDVGELDTGELGAAAVGETLLHIPCPNGHELEVPLDMLNQRVMCPHCSAEFRLRREKSVEYLRQQELIDRKRAEFWFKLAIIAAFVVGGVLVIMFLATMIS